MVFIFFSLMFLKTYNSDKERPIKTRFVSLCILGFSQFATVN